MSETDFEMQNLQFYFGANHSGSPMHFHRDAINVLIQGSKKWQVLPPSRAMYSKMPASEYFATVLRNRMEGTCIQHAGDALFVPAGWSHAVLNLGDVVGAAFEFMATDSAFRINIGAMKPETLALEYTPLYHL